MWQGASLTVILVMEAEIPEGEARERVAEVSRALFRFSLLVAGLAWIVFIVLHVLLRRKPVMWILTLGWPIYYAMVVGVVYGMLGVSKRGGPAANWPFFPDQAKRFVNRFNLVLARAALILFPLAFLLMGVAGVVAVATGR